MAQLHLFTSNKAGVGKSTLALSTALSYIYRGYKVSVIDVAYLTKNISEWLTQFKGLSEDRETHLAKNILFHEITPEFNVFFPPKKYAFPELSEFYSSVDDSIHYLRKNRKHSDLYVIDTDFHPATLVNLQNESDISFFWELSSMGIDQLTLWYILTPNDLLDKKAITVLEETLSFYNQICQENRVKFVSLFIFNNNIVDVSSKFVLSTLLGSITNYSSHIGSKLRNSPIVPPITITYIIKNILPKIHVDLVTYESFLDITVETMLQDLNGRPQNVWFFPYYRRIASLKSNLHFPQTMAQVNELFSDVQADVSYLLSTYY